MQNSNQQSEKKSEGSVGLVLHWQMMMYLYIFNLNYLKYHFNHLFGFTAQPTTTGWCWVIKLLSCTYKLLGEHEASLCLEVREVSHRK